MAFRTPSQMICLGLKTSVSFDGALVLLSTVQSTNAATFCPTESIDVHDNAIVGTLPAEIGDISSLKILNLGKNDFKGSLPSTWSNLSNLNNLYVEENPNLWGTVPSLYSSLTSLGEFISLLVGAY